MELRTVVRGLLPLISTCLHSEGIFTSIEEHIVAAARPSAPYFPLQREVQFIIEVHRSSSSAQNLDALSSLRDGRGQRSVSTLQYVLACDPVWPLAHPESHVTQLQAICDSWSTFALLCQRNRRRHDSDAATGGLGQCVGCARDPDACRCGMLKGIGSVTWAASLLWNDCGTAMHST